ncbi:MAG: YkgJ family cysteine cluster protein [Candidatus Binataceae bacterium]|jgi:Fe-S-cluster containining protein
MSYSDTLARVDFALKRDSVFSYQCNACSRCCHNKVIRVGPYEILRLARRLGMTTTEFIAQHTEAGGTVLRTHDENNRACIFLNQQGCSVHPDRPLACRLYPLARWVDPDGRESFGHLTPHPKTKGSYGTSATVADYLDEQGVAPFIEMGDRYGVVYQRMVEVLGSLDPEELDRRSSRRDDVDEKAPGLAASSWIDIDKTIADFCKLHRRPVPDDLEGTVAVHIEAIESWLASL